MIAGKKRRSGDDGLVLVVASLHGCVRRFATGSDPCVTQEEVSAIDSWVTEPTWRQDALQRKLNGESSMFGKPWCMGTALVYARQDPVGMAKATLLEA